MLVEKPWTFNSLLSGGDSALTHLVQDISPGSCERVQTRVFFAAQLHSGLPISASNGSKPLLKVLALKSSP